MTDVATWAASCTEYFPELAHLVERDGVWWLPVPGPRFSGEPQHQGWVGTLVPLAPAWVRLLELGGYKVDVCCDEADRRGALFAYLGVG